MFYGAAGRHIYRYLKASFAALRGTCEEDLGMAILFGVVLMFVTEVIGMFHLVYTRGAAWSLSQLALGALPVTLYVAAGLIAILVLCRESARRRHLGKHSWLAKRLGRVSLVLHAAWSVRRVRRQFCEWTILAISLEGVLWLFGVFLPMSAVWLFTFGLPLLPFLAARDAYRDIVQTYDNDVDDIDTEFASLLLSDKKRPGENP